MGPNFSASTNSWFIGSFAIIHFLIVSIAGLGPLIVYLMEGSALKNNNSALQKLARQLLTIVLELAASGGILGSGVVIVLVGLRPMPITLVFNIFFWLIVFQLICFIAGLAFTFAYYFSWEKQTKNHRTWGLLASIFPLIPYVVFSAAVSFITTPGNWPLTGNVWQAVFNPSMIVSLLHRAGAGVSLLGVLVIALHIFKVKKTDSDEKAYHQYAVKFGSKLALRALEAQIVIGIVRYFFVSEEGRKMISGGSLTAVWTIGIVAGIIAWAFLFFSTRKKELSNGATFFFAALIPVVLSVSLMGITRSKERGEFSIRDIMTRDDKLSSLPANYQVSNVPTGESIFKENCGACHPGLAGDAFALAKKLHPEAKELATYLRDPSAYKKAMPPYKGSLEEIKILVAHLLDIPVDQVDIE
jgi:cytochrome bd-type quinol oxidase subunit 1